METEKRLTSAEIKKQIQEATKTEKLKEGVKDGSIPMTQGVVNEINASTPEASKAESKTQPEKASEKETVPTKESVDLKEWAKSKGYDTSTEESVLSVLRKADQTFHKKRQDDKAKEKTNIPPYVPQPTFNGYAQPPYVAPPNPREVIQGLAQTYGFTPDDVERLAKFNRDQFEIMTRQLREQSQAEIEEIKIENQKNSVFRELSSDPVFRNPNVAAEYQSVLEQMQGSDPQSFEKDPYQYRRALDIAVNNLGRRYLEGKQLVEGQPPQPNGFMPPSNPPKSFGQGSGGGYQESETAIDSKAFAKMSLEEKKKTLEGMGLRTTY